MHREGEWYAASTKHRTMHADVGHGQKGKSASLKGNIDQQKRCLASTTSMEKGAEGHVY